MLKPLERIERFTDEKFIKARKLDARYYLEAFKWNPDQESILRKIMNDGFVVSTKQKLNNIFEKNYIENERNYEVLTIQPESFGAYQKRCLSITKI